MATTNVLAHRPFIGASAGLLLVSACGDKPEPTPRAAIDVVSDHEASPPVTMPATTDPPVTALPVAPAPMDAVDVADGTVFGVGVFDAIDVDAVTRDVSSRLGAPTADSGWQSMIDRLDCTGSTEAGVLWWGDLRMTFERYESDDDVREELSTAAEHSHSGSMMSVGSSASEMARSTARSTSCADLASKSLRRGRSSP